MPAKKPRASRKLSKMDRLAIGWTCETMFQLSQAKDSDPTILARAFVAAIRAYKSHPDDAELDRISETFA